MEQRPVLRHSPGRACRKWGRISQICARFTSRKGKSHRHAFASSGRSLEPEEPQVCPVVGRIVLRDSLMVHGIVGLGLDHDAYPVR